MSGAEAPSGVTAVAQVVEGEVWAWLNRMDAPWSPSDDKVRDLAFAAAERIAAHPPHAYGVETLWNRGGSSERWGMAMAMADYRQPLTREDAEELIERLIEDGHAADAVRLVAIAVHGATP